MVATADMMKNDETVESTASQESSDNSNPQQGTFRGMNYANSQNQPVKIPPAGVDDRKLFVGGLPPDGTIDALTCVDAICVVFTNFSSFGSDE